MTLHPQAAQLLAMIESLGLPELEDSTPEEARTLREAMARPSSEPIAETRDFDAAGVPVRFYRPEVSRSDGLLVWLHGGGWVLGDLESHDDPCRAMANRGGFAVLSADYRLAPEHPFPAAVDDALAVTQWAIDHAGDLGCDPNRVAVGGDSAGGNLAAVVANSGIPVVFQLLVYPATDARMGHPSIDANGEGLFLTKAGIEWFYGHYLSGDASARDDPRLSPLLDSDERIATAPAALVLTAEHDPLRDEGAAYAARLSTAGVPTTHVDFAGQIHAFFSMSELIDDARSAHALVAEAVHQAISRKA